MLNEDGVERNIEFLGERFKAAMVRAKDIPKCDKTTNGTEYFGLIS